jgi:rRNA maturation endonuclease Nob1
MNTPTSKWLLHCTSCYAAFEQHRFERDVICQRCGGFVEITEHITFIENTKDKNNDDLCSN